MIPSPTSSPPFDPVLWNRHALLTCAEMRRAESLAVQQGPLSFYDLMQAAGRAVAQAVQDRFPRGRVLVLCGAGNNGGDGYVAAQALETAGWPVRVGALAPPATPEARQAAQAWQGETLPLSLDLLDHADLVVDALFGTGLSRPLSGEAAVIAVALDAMPMPVVSADMPSGVSGDTGRALGPSVRANVTVTFFRPKRGHATAEGLPYCGEVLVANTGMEEEVLFSVAPKAAENGPELWTGAWPSWRLDGHKYHRGHAVVFGGPTLTGASRLAARAAQRVGAGLVTLATPREAWPVYAAALESVMVLPNDDEAALWDDPRKNVFLIGPGLGRDERARKLVDRALTSGKPGVWDADALALLADRPEGNWGTTVLTPHEGEFARLFAGRVDPAQDKITRAVQAAALTGATVLLKGRDTVIAGPDGHAVVNLNAPPWLATGGAGDVLAGMIAGLMAAGMPPFAASCAAVFLHGEAAARLGPGLIAEDLVAALPPLIRERARWG